jgi:hypothetical protein
MRTVNGLLIAGIALATVMPVSAGQTTRMPVYQEQNQRVIMEVESAPPAGDWKAETDMDGYTGTSYYTWRGPNLFGTPGRGVLTYAFRIHTPGTYFLHVRNRHDFHDFTEENDAWIQLDGGRWIKTFSSVRGRWTHHSHHELSHHHKPPAKYELDAGIHVLRFSGRSKGYSIDRIILATADAKNPKDDSLKPSPTKVEPVELPDGPESKTFDPIEQGVTGELRRWHRVTVNLLGPDTGEDASTNPFTDYRCDVTFRQGDRDIVVPGFYAADGHAAHTGASKGNVWRAHFMPPSGGQWTWTARFRTGDNVAVSDDPDAGQPTAFDGATGTFTITASDKTGRDFRRHGLLEYVGKHHLRFAGSGQWYLKGGADSPENFLAFTEFDGTRDTNKGRGAFLHAYEDHIRDWQPGDPTWRDGVGKGIIGAVNYLASTGMNSIYFLTYNLDGGDGKDVWPWTGPAERKRFDCSKLAQWEIVFSHMARKGVAMHVVTQETENDNKFDGGRLGDIRKLYYRELVARFAHHPALVWNLGEENTNTDAERKAFAKFIRGLDPYDHPIVCHTYPGAYSKVYQPLLGYENFEGPSLQMSPMKGTHKETLEWRRRSAQAGRPWFVCLDEVGPAGTGVKPDSKDPHHDKVRTQALWGNLMAGGAGCEWYFGYSYAHNDLNCEDWRSRANMWKQTRIALEFFQQHLPFWRMTPADELASDGAWCLAQAGKVYAVYLPDGGTTRMTLPAGTWQVRWYNPRQGGPLITGPTDTVTGGQAAPIGQPPAETDKDWAALLTPAP